jgi:hypothetical protein
MTPNVRYIQTAADANQIRPEIESVYDGWFADVRRIDWEEFLDRLEEFVDIDMGGSMTTPAVARIKQIVSELRAQMR